MSIIPFPLHAIRMMVGNEPPDWAEFILELNETAEQCRKKAKRDLATDNEFRGRELIRIHDEAMRAAGTDDPPSEAMMAAGNAALLNELCPPPKRLEPATWEQKLPPPRDWLVPGALPGGRLTSLYGSPGIGKSTLAQQLAAAVMHGGCPVRPLKKPGSHPLTREIPEDRRGRVLWVTWEDETHEFIRRWHRARTAEGISGPEFPDPNLLTVLQMVDFGSIWGPDIGDHHATVSTWTSVGKVVVDMMDGYRLLVIDPIASAYSGSEIDRSAVRAFCSALDAAGRNTNCTPLLLGHFSKAAAATGQRYSGSTDWEAAPRAMMEMDYLNFDGRPRSGPKDYDDRRRAVTITKLSYGAKDDTPLWLFGKTDSGYALVEGDPPAKSPVGKGSRRGETKKRRQPVNLPADELAFETHEGKKNPHG